jgi:hypothetical protein
MLKVLAERGARLPLLAVLLILGFAIRTYYASARHVCFGDESCYLVLAQNLFKGLGYTYYNSNPELHFPPLFPIILGVFNWVVRDWEVVSRVVYVIFSGLIPLPVYLLGSGMYGRRVGLLAAFLAAILPPFTTGVLFAESMSEPPYLFFIFSGLYLVYRASVAQRFLHYALAGASLSLGYLIRPEGVAYLGIGFLYLAGLLILRRPLPTAAALRRLAVFAASFLVLASPYILYLHSHTGKWSLTTKSITSYTTTRALVDRDPVAFQKDTWGLNEDGEIWYYAHDFDQGLLSLLTGPYRDRVIPDILENLRVTRSTLRRRSVFGHWPLCLSAVGFLGAIFLSRRYSAEVLNLLVVASPAGFLFFFIRERLVYCMLLPLLLWFACAISYVFQFLQWKGLAHLAGFRRLPMGVLQSIVVLAMAAYFILNGFKYFEREINKDERVEVWVAAAWLKENTPEDSVIMSTGPEVAFHAGRRWLPVPVATRSKVVQYGRERGATHLCLRGEYLVSRPEQKRELYDNAQDFDDLELLRKDEDLQQPGLLVYRLRDPLE